MFLHVVLKQLRKFCIIHLKVITVWHCGMISDKFTGLGTFQRSFLDSLDAKARPRLGSALLTLVYLCNKVDARSSDWFLLILRILQ